MRLPEWRAVPGFESYAVSDDGRVLRIATAATRRAGTPLRGSISQKGYRVYRLRAANGRSVERGAHRLVALAFIGPPPSPDHEVAHWDGCKTNNAPSNLRWATPAENSADTARLGVLAGSRHPRARLSWDLVGEIRANYRGSYGEQSQLARRYGVSPSTIRLIVTGTNWKLRDESPERLEIEGQ